MALISFMPKFAAKVASGGKTQTVRRQRARPIKVGTVLHLYTGLRTKQSRKLGVAVCTAVVPVFIGTDGLFGVLSVDGKEFGANEAEIFARADGFALASDFFDFFLKRYGPSFNGVLIMWGSFVTR